ncbi:hypothetical protein FRC10_006567 [Ceratobasidium sp. 414]|nr:hypothetical protein FRC10_006567 [Ceratobasidium sp. 414]
MAGILGDVPYFDPKLEVKADEIPRLNLANSRHYVTAVVNMSWPFRPGENITKYSFTAQGKQTPFRFDADFAGDVELKLNDRVLICLKGVQVSARPIGRYKLPFKLEFLGGFIIQVNGQTIDTFPGEEPPVVALPAWFSSQLPPQPDPPSPQLSAKSEVPSSPPENRLDAPLNDTLQAHGMSLFNYGPPSEVPSAIIPETGFPPAEPMASHHLVIRDAPTTQANSWDKRPFPSTQESTLSVARQSPRPSSDHRTAPDPARSMKQPVAPKSDPEAQRPKKRRRRRDKKSLAEPARNPALDMVAGFYSNLYGPFIPLASIPDKLGAKVSVIGLVRGISIPQLTRNGDWSCVIELLDPSVTEESAFVINLFLPPPLENCMPNVKAGDIAMFLKIASPIQVVCFSGKFRGTGYPDTFQWAGYSLLQKAHFHSVQRTFSELEHCPFFTPGPEELQYTSELAEWWNALQDLARTKPNGVPALMTEPRGRSLMTLSEAKADVFFNCIVEILFKAPPGDQAAEIFVTDYTVHPQFYPRQLREDPKTTKQDQVKVYGQRVLKVMLWGPTQLEHSRELDVPGYYYIDNLRVKFDSKGHLEGTLQDEKRKIDKMRRDDPMLEDLLKRKDEYFSHPPSPGPSASRANLAKGQDPNLYSAGDLLPPAPAALVPKQVQVIDQNNKSPITRLLYYNIVQTPIQQVLGHGSCPEIFRIRARVAAFEPYQLANFAHGFCTKCKADFIPGAVACHECADFDGEFVGYEYRFRLCVEAEPVRPSQNAYRASLILDVSGKDAEMFLSGVPPQDFHQISNARKLRARLAPIFGSLEAYQCDLAVGDSAKALTHGQYFEMLVQSYKSTTKSEGSLDNKRYRLWGTELLPNVSK